MRHIRMEELAITAAMVYASTGTMQARKERVVAAVAIAKDLVLESARVSEEFDAQQEANRVDG